MEISGARVFVTGATGVLGEALARALQAEGARVALGGRDGRRLALLADELDAPCVRFDAADLDRCSSAVEEACVALGGLDALAVTTGVAAFGPVTELEDETALEVVTTDLLAPIAMVRRALTILDRGGVVVGVSAVVADVPSPDMAVYSAAKAGFSAFLTAVRRENRRRGVRVLDVRPPHLDTGFEQRAVAGHPPALPEPYPAERVVAAVLQGMRDGSREVAWDLQARELVVH